MTDLTWKVQETISTGGTCLLLSCEKPNAPSRRKWRTRYCPSLHSRRPWFVLVYDPAGENLVKLWTFFPKNLVKLSFFFRKSCHHCFNFISENLVKLSTFFPQKILSNFQLFYFNYCYNEASRLGALSRYQIKREETSDEGGVLIQSQKEHEF